MKKFRNRIVSALLALTMVASMLPAGIFTPAAQAADSGFTMSDVVVYTDGSFEFKLHSTLASATTSWTPNYVAGILDATPYQGVQGPSTGTMSFSAQNSTSALGNTLRDSFEIENTLYKTASNVVLSSTEGSSCNWTYTFRGNAGALITDADLRTALAGSSKSYYNGSTPVTKDTETYTVCLLFRTSANSTFRRVAVPMTKVAEKLPANLAPDPATITDTPAASTNIFTKTITVLNGDGDGKLEAANLNVGTGYPIVYTGNLSGKGTLTWTDGTTLVGDNEDDYAEYQFAVTRANLPANTKVPLYGTIRVPYYDGLGTGPDNIKYFEIEVNMPVPNGVGGTVIEVTVTAGGSSVNGTTTLTNRYSQTVELMEPEDAYKVAEKTGAPALVTGAISGFNIAVESGAFSTVSFDGDYWNPDGNGYAITRNGSKNVSVSIAAPAGTTAGDYTGTLNLGWADNAGEGAGDVAPITVIVHVIEGETTYVLNFNANGGGSLSSTSWSGTDADATFTWPTATPSSGKLFKGWYTAASSGSQIATSNNTWNKVKTAGASVSGTTMTVYAQWVDEYTVTFDSNGGSTADQTIKTDVNGHIVSNPSDPQRQDYSFLGWFDTEAHANAATASNSTGAVADWDTKSHNGDTTYWAGWSQNTYTATINLLENGGSTKVSGATVALGSGASATPMAEGSGANAGV